MIFYDDGQVMRIVPTLDSTHLMAVENSLWMFSILPGKWRNNQYDRFSKYKKKHDLQ